MLMKIPDHIELFWQRFLASESSPEDASDLFLESFHIGSTPDHAAHGARLILNREKTATSSLLWEYHQSGKPQPFVGALSVVEDGERRAVCVVETTWVKVIPFTEVDESFSRDYGETDGTIKNWYEEFEGYYRRLCESMGRELTQDTPLVCERFRVIFR